jgi:hypothetical protein
MAMKFVVIGIIAMVLAPWLLGTFMRKFISRRDQKDECDNDDSVFRHE